MYQEACLALGLIKDDSEYDNCIDEVKDSMMPRALRKLLANILIACKPMNPLALWEKYKKYFAEDFINGKLTKLPKELAIKKAYAIVNMFEVETGKKIETIENFKISQKLNIS